MQKTIDKPDGAIIVRESSWFQLHLTFKEYLLAPNRRLRQARKRNVQPYLPDSANINRQ